MLGVEKEAKQGQFVQSYREEIGSSLFMKLLRKENEGIFNEVSDLITEYAFLTGAHSIHVIDGNEEKTITDELHREGKLIKLNESNFPNCYLYRSPPFDVARSEKDTYICTERGPEEVGPTNNWMNSRDAMKIAISNLKGSMAGKVLYAVPYWLGPLSSGFGDGGFELTDSRYVVLNLMKITRVGEKVAKSIAMKNSYVLGLHSTARLNPEKRFIMHFPDENRKMGLVVSFNTDYGGNALLSKKCHALRIASFKARREGWLAEHMMLIEVKDPSGKSTFISGAFPSSSGKTNLSMLKPPEHYAKEGWATSLISDDITWMNNVEGTLRGINPEYGFFGVAPHTSMKTNPGAMEAIMKNTLFTNVGIDRDRNPFWEGMGPVPDGVIDWQGRVYDGKEKIAHPNSRFTTPIHEYADLSKDYENPMGAPVSAFLFGGRRSDLIPLIMEAKSWNEGVLFGAMQRVETTAAAIGKVGELRNDPMAMRPFMPYNMGEYFQHYIEIGKILKNPPKIYNVNWFRKDGMGNFIWPGYSENMRVVEWIVKRIDGTITSAVDTPMGYVPNIDDLRLPANVERDKIKSILEIDAKGFLNEFDTIEPFFKSFGSMFPEELWRTYHNVRDRLEREL
ncbi:MAG: phosphoenolpyruvate carboxykinase (GTP) [Candidatus Thermoplasmatota archaeon]|jgi:phosphoenolpyruvate carboxykinase (GTP)|nr:phosphoenolpyruvate carboxykinase (GTP) [Candidatus Thermoplasmatota archaeon]